MTPSFGGRDPGGPGASGICVISLAKLYRIAI
jgi:hypothetical protein